MNTGAVNSGLFLAQERQPIGLVGRPGPADAGGHSLVWPLLWSALCLAALAAVIVRARRRRAAKAGRPALKVLARSLGLSPAQRRLVASMGGPEPAVILISETAFRAAVERWVQTDPDGSKSRELLALAQRLGWSLPEANPRSAIDSAPHPKLKLVA